MQPLVGVILSVKPSDAKGNLAGETHPALRGCHHECMVWAAEDYGMPSVLLDHVIIPPESHSGIDNYDEDLPRGVSSLIDGQPFQSDLRGIDPCKLDGEWCVVGFIGGKITHPYIMSWWPHPANTYDPATSGNKPATAEGQTPAPTLVQYDLKLNRSRRMWRKNGTLFLVNRDGSVYLDTSEANRKVNVGKDNLLSTSRFPKGGHAQVDIKQTAQLEVNWNETFGGPQIGAGSTFKTMVCGEQVGSGPNCMFEPDFPQDQPPPNPEPTVPPRSTARTIIQGREYQVIVKTGKLVLAAQAGGGSAGEVDLLVDALLKMRAGVLASIEAPQVEINAPTSLDVAAGTVSVAATGNTKVEAPKIHFDIADQFKIDSTETAITASDLLTFQGNEVEVVGLRNIILNTKTLYLGNVEGSVPAVLGDQLTGLLSALLTAIQAIVIDPGTMGINPASYAVFDILREQLAALLSNSVRLIP